VTELRLVVTAQDRDAAVRFYRRGRGTAKLSPPRAGMTA
jgi:hypothetical protein